MIGPSLYRPLTPDTGFMPGAFHDRPNVSGRNGPDVGRSSRHAGLSGAWVRRDGNGFRARVGLALEPLSDRSRGHPYSHVLEPVGHSDIDPPLYRTSIRRST